MIDLQFPDNETGHRVLSDLREIISMPNNAFAAPKRPGYMRGIDYYTANQLAHVMVRAYDLYHQAHGVYPDIKKPKLFNEWIVRRKFFEYLKIPESGNKFYTAGFIPAHYQGVRCANILWCSEHPILPDNYDIPAGRYFLKANHGSGMNMLIDYPLMADDKKKLEDATSQWLAHYFGLTWGEWWYSAFPKRLLIEEYLGDNLLSYNFFCFRGDVKLLVAHDKITDEKITITPDLRVIYHQNPLRDPNNICSTENLQRMFQIASKISADHDFVRVDLLISDNQEIILGEVTFSPGNGLSKRAPGVNEYLGQAWSQVVRI